ncbi:unnamed protein product [Alternaria alternata]
MDRPSLPCAHGDAWQGIRNSLILWSREEWKAYRGNHATIQRFPSLLLSARALPNTLASITTKTSSRVKPLTDSTNLTWTRSRLEKERGDWWDTQVTGSEQIWRAVRLVAHYLQAGELQEAQTMLDANDCTCPTGLLWRGVYDPTGVQYKIPEWVVVEPEGLAEEDDMDDKDVAGDARSSAIQESLDDPVDDDSNGLIRVRIRTSHDQKDVPVVIRMRDTVAIIIEKLKQQAKLDSTVKVRLAYGGRVSPRH